MSEYQLYLKLGGIKYKVKKPSKLTLTINFYKDSTLDSTITQTYASGTTISPTSIATQYLPTDYEVDSTTPTDEFTITSDTTLSVYYKLAIEMPVKGDLITMELGNATPAAGTNNLYRVLNISGTVAEVVAMFDISTSQKWSLSDQVYSGSLLDTALNTTWYNTLSDEAKAAIVDNTITQYTYTSSSSSYNSSTHASYAAYSTKAVKGSGLTRHIYALDVEDIEMYFGGTGGSASSNTQGTFSTSDIWKLFWNTTSQSSNYTYPWLRSVCASNSYDVWCVDGDNGRVDRYNYYGSFASRPAFKIDLSKISWTKN